MHAVATAQRLRLLCQATTPRALRRLSTRGRPDSTINMLHKPSQGNQDSAEAPSTSPPPTSSSSSKLIFAPGTDPTSTQAAQFTHGTLSRSQLSPSPFTQFHNWFTQASIPGQVPEACTLSTAQLPSGRVSARMVYLKELDARGFVIYSNFGTSAKSKDLDTNPWASLVFWWKPLERQVRVEGKTERLTAEESQRYFDTRARGSRVGAWASRQSETLEPDARVEGDDGRKKLDGWVEEIERKFEGQDKIPVPEFWGGLRILPESVEFWQGRESRLHDRFRYTKLAAPQAAAEEQWEISRLSP